MKLECPYGWESVSRIGSVTLQSATVNICDGVCDSCDLCGIEACEFHDISHEASRRFFRTQAQEQTLKHLLAPIN